MDRLDASIFSGEGIDEHRPVTVLRQMLHACKARGSSRLKSQSCVGVEFADAFRIMAQVLPVSSHALRGTFGSLANLRRITCRADMNVTNADHGKVPLEVSLDEGGVHAPSMVAHVQDNADVEG